MFRIRYAVSAIDNHQGKPAGKDYVNVIPVWPMCVYIYIIYNIDLKLDNRIYLYTIIYSCAVNVNLMLICIELSEMWSFIVNMPEKSQYLK